LTRPVVVAPHADTPNKACSAHTMDQDGGPARSRGATAPAASTLSDAAKAICRALRGGLLDAVVRLCGMDARSGAELKQRVAAGADAATVGADAVAVLGALSSFCGRLTGAARVVAAGLLPHVVVMMRSPDPAVAYAAAALCLGAARTDPTANAALAREPGAVPPLLSMLRGDPSPCGIKAPAVAAELLSQLSVGDSRANAAAARAGGASAGACGCTVAAAVLAGGDVARMVALLRAALGGGGQALDASSAAMLLAALNVFGTNPAAAAAARAAGALPLAARAIVAAHRTPGLDTTEMLLHGTFLTAVLPAEGDLPALAAQPDLVGALAGAVALAAGGASEGWSAYEAERLGKFASTCVANLLTGGRGSGDAAAEGFVAAGGAAHLVRRRARVSGGHVGQGPARGRARTRCGHSVALWLAHCSHGLRACHASSPPPNANFRRCHPLHSQPLHRCGFCPTSPQAALRVGTSLTPSAPWRRCLRAAAPCGRPARRPPYAPWPPRLPPQRRAAPGAGKRKQPSLSRRTPSSRSRRSCVRPVCGCKRRWAWWLAQ
jgi:hypothetical protein